MEQIITWAMTYSPPVFAFLIVGAALVYVLKRSVDKTMDSHFQQQNTLLALAMERRSRFNETILLQRYNKAAELQTQFSRVMIELRRHFRGIDVPELFRGHDIPTLTNLFQGIADYHFVLTDRLHDVLYKEAQLALRFAQSPGKDISAFDAEQEALQKEFRNVMNREFSLDQISYFAPELAGIPGLPRSRRPIEVAPQSGSPGAERS